MAGTKLSGDLRCILLKNRLLTGVRYAAGEDRDLSVQAILSSGLLWWLASPRMPLHKLATSRESSLQPPSTAVDGQSTLRSILAHAAVISLLDRGGRYVGACINIALEVRQ